MKRLGRLVILALMTAALMLPGFAGTASAQDAAALCAQAKKGTPVDGYTIVYGTGGSGSQIVLGTDGDDYLSGGSGNDVLCGFGGYDILEGGSGNDLLVNGPGGGELYGGSGNDTLIGYVGDIFDGGSGRNEQVEHQSFDLWVEQMSSTGRTFFVLGSGFTPDATIALAADYYDQEDQQIFSDSQPGLTFPIVNSSGNFSTRGSFGFFGCTTHPGGQEFAYVIITATENETGNSYQETFTPDETCFE